MRDLKKLYQQCQPFCEMQEYFCMYLFYYDWVVLSSGER